MVKMGENRKDKKGEGDIAKEMKKQKNGQRNRAHDPFPFAFIFIYPPFFGGGGWLHSYCPLSSV